jgi:hypothetical protein
MRIAGRISGEALALGGELVKPGVSTKMIDDKIRHYIEKCGAKPSFLGYGGFPGSACISINDQVIHGIPSADKILEEGDIVKIDVGAYIHGYHGDNANTFACGKISDEPEYVAAMARSRGLDFVFITDHFQPGPSVMAAEKLSKFDSCFKVFPGEECHPPRERIPEPMFYNRYVFPPIHHLSLGADRGVVKYTCDHYEEYTAFLEKRMAELDQSVPEDQRRMMAAVDWIVDRTHEFGGVAVYAHPFWRPALRFNQPKAVREYIMDNAKFDAVEVFGLGSGAVRPDFDEGNDTCVNWLCEQSIRLGRHINVTGSTDTHDAASLIGYQYTVAFAADCELEDIKNAIRSGNTVAVSAYPGERRHVWGKMRLVHYVNFLFREYFPEHDEACSIDGKLMLQVQRGEIPVETANAYGKGRLEMLRKRWWAAE